MSVSDFYNQYMEINSYLPYLPGPLNVSYDEVTVFSHIKKSVPAFAKDFMLKAAVLPTFNNWFNIT